jgi:hypothetical protein
MSPYQLRLERKLADVRRRRAQLLQTIDGLKGDSSRWHQAAKAEALQPQGKAGAVARSGLCFWSSKVGLFAARRESQPCCSCSSLSADRRRSTRTLRWDQPYTIATLSDWIRSRMGR